MEVKIKIEQLISQTKAIDGGIPAPWLVFDFVLHKYAKSKQLHKVDREKCNEIAKVCHLKDDEIEYVLYFLHSKAGTILYYYNIPELKNWIITDFQLIIDSISEVIVQYFDDNGNIGRMGQVKIQTLRSIDGYLDVNQLLSLMKHRHIISYKEKANTFFMPSLLPKADGTPVSSQSSDTLLVIFESGYSPVGLFCAVSTYLIDSHNWEINTTVSQCRSNMSFCYMWSGAQYGIVFTAFSTYYEVNLSSNVEYQPNIKFDIYNSIQESFTAVCKDIDLIPPSYGFYCTCDGTGCPQHEHTAKVVDGYEKMECCYSHAQSELNEQQKAWFCQVSPSLFACKIFICNNSLFKQMKFNVILMHILIIFKSETCLLLLCRSTLKITKTVKICIVACLYLMFHDGFMYVMYYMCICTLIMYMYSPYHMFAMCPIDIKIMLSLQLFDQNMVLQ